MRSPEAVRPSSLDPAVAARLKRDSHGLVAAIAQQYDTGEVLMLAWTGGQIVPDELDADGSAAEKDPAHPEPLPQRVGQAILDAARLPPVGRAPDVLVVHEVLHQVGPLVHTMDSEERQCGRPIADLRHQVRERGAGGQRLGDPPCVARERPAQDARGRVGAAFPQHKMSGQVPGLPALAQRRRLRACLIEQGAQGRALVAGVAHPAMVRPRPFGDPAAARPWPLRRIGG